MTALYLLVAFSLLVALVFLAAFAWAVKSDQFRDAHTPAIRMLFDGVPTAPKVSDAVDVSNRESEKVITTTGDSTKEVPR